MVRLINEVRDNPRLRNLAYVAVGKIALRVPEVVTKDIAMLQAFFEAKSFSYILNVEHYFNYLCLAGF